MIERKGGFGLLFHLRRHILKNSLENIKHSVKQLNDFIKEKAIEGATFENQAIFNVLAREYAVQAMKAFEKGVNLKELTSFLEKENQGMKDYADFVGVLTSSYLAKNDKIVLN